MKNKNLKFCFYFLLFTFYLSAFGVGAKIPSEQLDPTDFLMPNSAETSKVVSTPNVSMQVAKLQQKLPGQSQGGSPGRIVPVNFATQVDKKLPQGGLGVIPNLNSHPGRQLWQEGISVPSRQKDEASKNELKRIIEQISSVEFGPQSQNQESAIVIELAPTIELNETLSDAETLVKSEQETSLSDKPKVQNRLPLKPVADQTLKILKELSQHPDRQDNPFELAEVLFLSGHLKEAGIFYREALNRHSADDADSAGDRAWILFQTGNCLRNDDMETAMKMYGQLIAEYPDSPWTDLAQSRSELISWYLKDKPETLIVESRL